MSGGPQARCRTDSSLFSGIDADLLGVQSALVTGDPDQLHQELTAYLELKGVADGFFGLIKNLKAFNALAVPHLNALVLQKMLQSYRDVSDCYLKIKYGFSLDQIIEGLQKIIDDYPGSTRCVTIFRDLAVSQNRQDLMPLLRRFKRKISAHP